MSASMMWRRLRQGVHSPRRLRTRLTISIAVAFALAGAALLGTQFLLAQRLVDSTSKSVFVATTGVPEPLECVNSNIEVLRCIEMNRQAFPDYVVFPDAADPGALPDAILPASQYLDFADIAFSQGKVAATLVNALARWSVIAVVVFAGLAAGLAWLVSRRSLRRLDDVASRVGSITHDRLDQRLAMGGPQDEVRDLAESFDAMLDRLDEAFAAQRLFVANASHELRTPLATIRTALDVSLELDRVPPDLEPALRRAVAATERSARVLDGLLVLARAADVTTTEFREEHGDLGEVCADIVERERERAEAAGVRIELRREFVPVVGDLDLLDQAVSNLVVNAIVHNVRGGRATVSASLVDGRAELQIVNGGPVIDPDHVPLLTEPFHRGAQTRLSGQDDGPGMGLGLAIVAQIAERLHGDLRLRAREQGGLTVTMSLPPVGHASYRPRLGACAFPTAS